MSKLKKILFKPTNTIPFMFGLFIGMTMLSQDIMYNGMVTALSGSTFHVIKASLFRI